MTNGLQNKRPSRGVNEYVKFAPVKSGCIGGKATERKPSRANFHAGLWERRTR